MSPVTDAVCRETERIEGKQEKAEPPHVRQLTLPTRLVRHPRSARGRHAFRRHLAFSARVLRRSVRMSLFCCLLLGSVHAAPGHAGEQMRSLDEQVQEIKSDVLSIAAELARLEEKLLYPSNTQVAVFVSLEEGESFQLDSVQVRIDDEAVARHLYSFKELEALKKGGVQRIYTGNVATGEHELEVTVAGKLPGGRDSSATRRFSFTKDVEPKLLGITLAGQGLGEASIRLGAW